MTPTKLLNSTMDVLDKSSGQTNTDQVNEVREAVIEAFDYAFKCASKKLAKIKYNYLSLDRPTYDFAFNVAWAKQFQSVVTVPHTEIQVREMAEGDNEDSFSLIYWDENGDPLEAVYVKLIPESPNNVGNSVTIKYNRQ